MINADDHWDILGNGQLDFQLPPVVEPVYISYITSIKPKQILLQPNNDSLNYTYSNGVARFNVPGVDIYSIIEVK